MGGGTRSQPRSALEVNPEVNPEAEGAGGTPLAVTQEDCLVSISVIFFLQIDRIVFCLFLPVDVDIYEELFQYYFPMEDTPDTKPDETEEKQGIFLLFFQFFFGWCSCGY